MYGIFMESFVIFKLYGGSGWLLALYFLSLIFLFFREKDRTNRILFVWMPLFLLFLFFLPLFRKVYVRLLGDGDTQYRILWLIPMRMTVALAGCRAATLIPMRGGHLLFKRFFDRLLVPVLVALAIVLCGSLVYQNPLVSRAENPYHIPSQAMEVADLIAPRQPAVQGFGRLRVRAAVPSDLVHFIRQYNTDIVLAFGRDIIAYGYYNEIYEAMEEPAVVDMEILADALREGEVTYVVLRKDRALDKDPSQVGLVYYGETTDYVVYEIPA